MFMACSDGFKDEYYLQTHPCPLHSMYTSLCVSIIPQYSSYKLNPKQVQGRK